MRIDNNDYFSSVHSWSFECEAIIDNISAMMADVKTTSRIVYLMLLLLVFVNVPMSIALKW
jgi:hypothetical protein